MFAIPECPCRLDRCASHDASYQKRDCCYTAEYYANLHNVAKSRIREKPKVEKENTDLGKPYQRDVDISENAGVLQVQRDDLKWESPDILPQAVVAYC